MKTENSLIYIYKEECLFVGLSICLFFMLLVPVSASVTKISTAYPKGQRKVKTVSARSKRVGWRGWVKFHPDHNILQFSPIFQEFWRIFSDFRLSPFRLYLFVLSVNYELLFDRNSPCRGCWVTSVWKYHNISPIRRVRICSCFVNESRTNEDKKLRLSRLHTRDHMAWKYIQIWVVYLLIDRILAYFNDQ